MRIQVSVEMPYVITHVTSVYQDIQYRATDTCATVELAGGGFVSGRDFELLVGMVNPHEPRMWVEDDGAGSKACMVCFYPRVSDWAPSWAAAATATEAHARPPTVRTLFLVDTSTSMGASGAIGDVRPVLQALLSNLSFDPASTVNVVRFGTGVNLVSVSDVPADRESVSSLLRDAVGSLEAHGGGTNLAGALEAVAAGWPASPNQRSNVVVISDGQVCTWVGLVAPTALF